MTVVAEQGLMSMARITRYSLYYRLMDISFVSAAISLCSEIIEYGFNLTLSDEVSDWLFWPIIITGLFIPAFCVFARFMRDDFAEMLWQKAAGTVLKALIILPVPLAFIVGMMVATGQIDVPESNFTDPAISESDGGAALGIILSFTYMWVIAPVVFTFAFQWHRWRASR
jgi:hypothetical protein